MKLLLPFPAPLAPKKQLTSKERKILSNLDQSVDFVNKYKKEKVKTKSINC